MNHLPETNKDRLLGPFDAASPDDHIGFDGRFYRYREYRYDHRSDALEYARLCSTRHDPLPAAADRPPPSWQVRVPTLPEPGLLEALAVTYDGRCFRYGAYRYDRWEDAVAYAQLKGRNGGRHPYS